MAAQDPGSTDKDLQIRDVQAFATSYPIAPGQSVTLGIGRAVKRDAVVVPWFESPLSAAPHHEGSLSPPSS
jgi:hypothetical protein